MRGPDTRLDWERCCTAPPRPLDMVIGGLSAGEIGLILNFAGYGRAWLALSMAVSVAADLPVAPCGLDSRLLSPPRRTGRVLLANAYDTPERLHRQIFLLAHWLQREHSAGRLQVPAGWNVRGIGANLSTVSLQLPPPLVVPGSKNEWVAGSGETWLRRTAEGARLSVLNPLWHDFDEHDAAPMATLVTTLRVIAQKTGSAFLLFHNATTPLPRGLAVLAERASWVWSVRPMDRETARRYSILESVRLRWLRVSEFKGTPASHPDRWLFLDQHGALVCLKPQTPKPEPAAT